MRRYAEPPRWTETRIIKDCELALEAFVERRLVEEGRPYQDAFAERLDILQRLFKETVDLRELEQARRREFAAPLRYLTGPPLSGESTCPQMDGGPLGGRGRSDGTSR